MLYTGAALLLLGGTTFTGLLTADMLRQRAAGTPISARAWRLMVAMILQLALAITALYLADR